MIPIATAPIPIVQRGPNVSETHPTRGAPAGAFGTGEALSDAGRVVGGVADRMLAEQQAEQRAAERERDAEAKAAAREADRVKSITAQAEAKHALADLHDGIGRGLLDGSVDKAKAGEDFTAQSQKIISQSLAGVSPEHQGLVKASLIDDVGRYQRGVTSLVDQKNRADIGAGMASYIEQMQRYAQRGEGERQEAIANIEAFVSSAGPAAGLRRPARWRHRKRPAALPAAAGPASG